MPVITAEKLKTFVPPPKEPDIFRVALSHEVPELYRGDKDFRIGKMLCNDYKCDTVHLGTNIASPADSRIFKTIKFPIDQLCELPENYHLLLMRTKLVYHRKGNISLGGFFRYTPGIVRQIRRWNPDLIFESPYLTLTPRSYMTFTASRMLKIPMVYIDAGDILPGLTLKHKVVLPVERQVVNRVEAIITYNEAGKKRFIWKYGCDPDRIHVIPKPVDIGRYNPDIDGNEFRKKYNLEDKFVVAYFGRICTNKGARYLLDAADILRKRGIDRDIVFLFVGGNIDPDQQKDFTDHLSELSLSNIRMTGHILNKDMPQAYAGVDLAVFPDVTNLPGFSTVLAESMASGLPIIIGIKGWEDAVPINDNENGLIIEPRNPNQIADRIEFLKNNIDFRKKLSLNVGNFACEKMAYERVLEEYIEIFEQLTGKSIYKNEYATEYAGTRS